MQTVRSQRRETAERLAELGATLPCPRCGSNRFGMIDGFGQLHVQDDVTRQVIGGLALPVAAAVCGQCGWVALHALAVLGLLPEGVEVVGDPDGGDT